MYCNIKFFKSPRVYSILHNPIVYIILLPLIWLIFTLIWFCVEKSTYSCMSIPNITFTDTFMLTVITQTTIGYGYRRIHISNEYYCIGHVIILYLQIIVSFIHIALFTHSITDFITNTVTIDKVKKLLQNIPFLLIILPTSWILYTFQWFILENYVKSCLVPTDLQFTSLLQYVIETQQTIGYGGTYLTTDSIKCLPHILVLICQVYTYLIHTCVLCNAIIIYFTHIIT